MMIVFSCFVLFRMYIVVVYVRFFFLSRFRLVKYGREEISSYYNQTEIIRTRKTCASIKKTIEI